MAPEIINNKVSIFPFDVDIESALGPQKGKVYKLNMTGMMVEVSIGSFLPQMAVKLKWVLPLENALMEQEGVVVKTYNQHKGDKMQYLIEVHFKKLKLQNQNVLELFLRKVESMTKRPAEKMKKAE